MPKPIYMKVSTYINSPDPIPVAYFINHIYQSVCLYAYPPIIAREHLDINVEENTKQATKKCKEQAEMLFRAYELEITYSTKLFMLVFKPVINSDTFRILRNDHNSVDRKQKI
jgi:hypothetical protein